jgi:ABC-type multidrug transport system ATPase subunit/ABC-type multidrug transport system permease subunit
MSSEDKHTNDSSDAESNNSDKIERFYPDTHPEAITDNNGNRIANSLSKISSRLSNTFTRASDVEGQTEEAIFANHLQNAMSNPQGIEKIQSLARTLSRKTKKEMQHFEIDDDDFDLKALLGFLQSKSDEENIMSSSAGVAFKNVIASGKDINAAYAPSVQEMVYDAFKFVPNLFKKDTTPHRDIIKDFAGVLQAGEMCLVLGRPGAGCSSFLKTLTGETGEFTSYGGDFSYDGLSHKEMIDHFKSYIIYNPELDDHFPTITVKETVDFALKTKTPNTRIDGMTRSQYVNNMRDLWCTVFGLRHTYATSVGNDFIRGVSGGERKRVSIVEALSCNASIYAWDNATRGLDASTALEFSQAIRTATNMLNNSAFVAIYQAGENIYELFDKVTVLYLGKQIYWGPASKAKAYFENMGYHCPSRMTTPEFLTSITDPNGRSPKPGYEGKVPETSKDFEDYWLNSPEYQELLHEYDNYISQHGHDENLHRFQVADSQRKQQIQRKVSPFAVSYFHQLYYLMIRGFHRARGDLTYIRIYISSFMIKGLIVGSMYYKIPTDTSGAYSRGGILFYCLLFCAVTSLAEIARSFASRRITLKQKSYSMYHISAEALQEIITEMPVKIIAVVILALTTYWMPHLKHEAGAFFMYMLFLFLVNQVFSFTFKLIATLTYDGETAHAFAGLWVLMLSVYAGFIMKMPYAHHVLKWVHWLNPMYYCYEQLLTTEFHGRMMKCAEMVPNGPSYDLVNIAHKVCSLYGSIAGNEYVSGDAYVKKQYSMEYKHTWRNFGINIAWTATFIILNTVLSEYLKNIVGGGDMLLYKRGHLPEGDQENVDGKVATKEEMIVALNGEGVDLRKVINEKDVFSWQNLDYTIPYDGATRQLLDNIQGYVKPGTMTALMGESGAGKTTLLNTLAQRINFGVITGDMLVNGRPIDSSFKRRTGYVQQQDLHLAECSVRESLRFAADLRRGKDVPQEEKYDYVEKIISLLGMENYAEAIVGKIGRGLNVEQRKKLSIAVELVSKPSLLLFLDEPTSGLDSQSAWSIVQFLRALADSGQAILCTIHQPSATLFEVFDRLLLLKKGGKTVYFGDIGPNSSDLLQYFERQSGVKCGKQENPAEYILNCIGAGATAAAQADWHELWINSPEYRAVTEEIAILHRELPLRPITESADNLKAKFATSWDRQLWTVLKRTWIQFWRSPIYIRAKFLECIACALFVGISYIGFNHSVSAANNSFSSVFMTLLIALAMINQSHVFAYPSRELYEVREAASNTFHWSCLLLAHTFIEIFWSTVCQFMCWVCFYWPTVQGHGTVERNGYFFFVYVLIFPMYFMSYGLWILYLSPNIPSASMINSMVFAALMLFCGILQPEQFMPGFWTFMYKTSPFTYFVDSFVSPLIHGRVVRCTKDEYLTFPPPAGQTCETYMTDYMNNATFRGYLEVPSATDMCNYCPYNTQDEVVSQFHVSWHHRWRNFGFFWCFIIFNFAAMLLCYYIMRVKVWSLKSVLDFKKWFQGPHKDRHEKDTTIFQAQPGDDKILKTKKQE